MHPSDHGGRRRGRWKAAVLLPAAIVMVSHAVVPVRAAESPSHDETRSTELVTPPKKTKKKKHKKKKSDTVPEMIEDVFGKRADEALRIAHCESKYRPDAVSYAGAVGVFQIRPRLHGWRVKKVKGGKDLRDAGTNIRVAYSLMKDQGWTPWVCARILGITRRRSVSYTSTTRGGGAPREPRRPRMAP